MDRTELDGILKRLAEVPGFTPDMLDDVKKIQDSWDEREGLLQEQQSAAEQLPDDERSDRGSDDTEDWKGKYDTLWQQYKDRFFSGVGAGDAMNSQEEDIKEDEDDDLDYDDLFAERGQKGDTADNSVD